MALLKIRHQVAFGYSGGKYHDDNALRDVLKYVLDPKKTPSGYIGGVGINVYNALYEMEAVSRYNGQDKGVRLRHMILSFDSKELARSKAQSAFIVYGLAKQIAQFYNSSDRRFQIVFAVHEDKKHIHVHFVMNTTDYWTGMKYDGSYADFYQFLDHVNSILETVGTRATYQPDNGYF